MSAEAIAALTGSLITILDMIERMNQRFPSEEAREQYIRDRESVRQRLMGLAGELRGPQEPAGDDLSHGYVASTEAGQDAAGDIPAGGSTPSESRDSTA